MKRSTFDRSRWTGKRAASLLPGFALLLACAGCAAPGSVAVDPDAEPVVYYRSENPATTRSELEYTTRDGSALGYVSHTSATPRAAVVYLHGISSHAGWFDAAGDGLAANGFDVFCLDRRGSGINRENRGYTSGYVDRYETLLDDIQDFVASLESRYSKVFLIGLSWGGKLALAYTLMHPGEVEAQVLITPGLVALVDVSPIEKVGIGMGTFLWPRSQVRTPIDPRMFTPTPYFVERIEADPIRLRYASTRFFWESHKLDNLVEEHVDENRLDTLLFLAEKDGIIDNAGVTEFMERGGEDRLTIREYVGQTHSLQFDTPERLVHDITSWFEPRLGSRYSMD